MPTKEQVISDMQRAGLTRMEAEDFFSRSISNPRGMLSDDYPAELNAYSQAPNASHFQGYHGGFSMAGFNETMAGIAAYSGLMEYAVENGLLDAQEAQPAIDALQDALGNFGAMSSLEDDGLQSAMSTTEAQMYMPPEMAFNQTSMAMQDAPLSLSLPEFSVPNSFSTTDTYGQPIGATRDFSTMPGSYFDGMLTASDPNFADDYMAAMAALESEVASQKATQTRGYTPATVFDYGYVPDNTNDVIGNQRTLDAFEAAEPVSLDARMAPAFTDPYSSSKQYASITDIPSAVENTTFGPVADDPSLTSIGYDGIYGNGITYAGLGLNPTPVEQTAWAFDDPVSLAAMDLSQPTALAENTVPAAQQSALSSYVPDFESMPASYFDANAMVAPDTYAVNSAMSLPTVEVAQAPNLDTPLQAPEVQTFDNREGIQSRTVPNPVAPAPAAPQQQEQSRPGMSRGTLTGGLIGGMLAGPMGAVVGAMIGSQGLFGQPTGQPSGLFGGVLDGAKGLFSGMQQGGGLFGSRTGPSGGLSQGAIEAGWSAANPESTYGGYGTGTDPTPV